MANFDDALEDFELYSLRPRDDEPLLPMSATGSSPADSEASEDSHDGTPMIEQEQGSTRRKGRLSLCRSALKAPAMWMAAVKISLLTTVIGSLVHAKTTAASDRLRFISHIIGFAASMMYAFVFAFAGTSHSSLRDDFFRLKLNSLADLVLSFLVCCVGYTYLVGISNFHHEQPSHHIYKFDGIDELGNVAVFNTAVWLALVFSTLLLKRSGYLWGLRMYFIARDLNNNSIRNRLDETQREYVTSALAEIDYQVNKRPGITFVAIFLGVFAGPVMALLDVTSWYPPDTVDYEEPDNSSPNKVLVFFSLPVLVGALIASCQISFWIDLERGKIGLWKIANRYVVEDGDTTYQLPFKPLKPLWRFWCWKTFISRDKLFRFGFFLLYTLPYLAYPRGYHRLFYYAGGSLALLLVIFFWVAFVLEITWLLNALGRMTLKILKYFAWVDQGKSWPFVTDSLTNTLKRQLGRLSPLKFWKKNTLIPLSTASMPFEEVGSIKFFKSVVRSTTSFSAVYVGELGSAGRPIAVKQVDTRKFNQFKNAVYEIDFLKKLQHDNVVKYLCEEEKDGFWYLAMELCDWDLRQALQNPCKSFLPTETKLSDSLVIQRQAARDICRQLAHGLHYLHGFQSEECCGIIHRDLKPENVLLNIRHDNADGNTVITVKLADLDMSRQLQDNNHSRQTKFGAGTSGYRAPELLKNIPPSEHISTASDIFALACLFYFVLRAEWKIGCNDNEEDKEALSADSANDDDESDEIRPAEPLEEDEDDDEEMLSGEPVWVLEETNHPFQDITAEHMQWKSQSADYRIMSGHSIINEQFVEEDFANLIPAMLSEDPESRPAIQAILSHPALMYESDLLSFICKWTERQQFWRKTLASLDRFPDINSSRKCNDYLSNSVEELNDIVQEAVKNLLTKDVHLRQDTVKSEIHAFVAASSKLFSQQSMVVTESTRKVVDLLHTLSSEISSTFHATLHLLWLWFEGNCLQLESSIPNLNWGQIMNHGGYSAVLMEIRQNHMKANGNALDQCSSNQLLRVIRNVVHHDEQFSPSMLKTIGYTTPADKGNLYKFFNKLFPTVMSDLKRNIYTHLSDRMVSWTNTCKEDMPPLFLDVKCKPPARKSGFYPALVPTYRLELYKDGKFEVNVDTLGSPDVHWMDPNGREISSKLLRLDGRQLWTMQKIMQPPLCYQCIATAASNQNGECRTTTLDLIIGVVDPPSIRLRGTLAERFDLQDKAVELSDAGNATIMVGKKKKKTDGISFYTLDILLGKRRSRLQVAPDVIANKRFKIDITVLTSDSAKSSLSVKLLDFNSDIAFHSFGDQTLL